MLVDDSMKIPVVRQKGLTYCVTRPPSSALMRSEEPVEGDAANEAIDVDADRGLSDGMTGIPPELMVDSESDGLGVGEWEDKGEDGEDFMMEQNQTDDEEAVPPSVKGKQVAKAKKNKCLKVRLVNQKITGPNCNTNLTAVRRSWARFKARICRNNIYQDTYEHICLVITDSLFSVLTDIQELRQNPAIAGTVVSTNKCKDVATVEDAPSAKRGKKTVGGLLPGWQKQEETSEGLAAVRASKPSMVKVREGQKGVEPKIKITEKSVTNVNASGPRGRGKHGKFTTSSLPFPGGALGAAYVAKWKKVAHATIIDRGAVELCAYSSIGAFTPLVIQDIWNEVFPDLDINIGTSALQILSNFFWEQSLTQDEIITYCKTERLNFKFIYRDPMAPPGKKGGLQSDLILQVFTCHFKKTAFAAKSYGLPVRGLGMSTAALERALSLWSSGVDPIKDEKGNKKTVSMFGKTTRLTPEDWALILTEANTQAGIFSADNDEEEDGVDPRTLIELYLPNSTPFGQVAKNCGRLGLIWPISG
ncbi:uncharacterized protein LACBIDRAFT_331268 [Laccaria bicolor S238N-H82]|uniref:Predicted protein n=1 Tax=Laccaria bicolor (strain S238N-H82 / ATCC MYA-4686) TaxID=486041 RepID=B0DNZ3_LACBS|nr:uncharacterized protein LACBIDRAFT_331268 [Laccaria bicolor S238N-H82]EDR03816.1 predicted protein [Laccaria bicolor S238N-H82]|eukprot:XP_001885669.1 predicted protein [Laccaria bicolor S238N-H82]